MQVEEIKVDQLKARKLFRQYNEHRGVQTPADREIAALYRQLARGKTVIRALASIAAAGLGADGLPRLAIARADERVIDCRMQANGLAVFDPPGHARARSRVFRVDGFQSTEWKMGKAVVPLIPVYLRPRAHLSNYHILWEADWKAYPVDPYLLRRFGGDAWLVVAAWELTDVERAVMAQRVGT